MAATSYASSKKVEEGSYSQSTGQVGNTSQQSFSGNSYSLAAASIRYPYEQPQGHLYNPYHDTSHECQNSTVYAQQSIVYASRNYYLQSAQDSYQSNTPVYESELTVEDEPNETSNITSHPATLTPSTNKPNIGRKRRKYLKPQHEYSTQDTAEYSQPMRTWSAQESADEMLRLGIPTYAPRQQYEYEETSSTYGTTSDSR